MRISFVSVCPALIAIYSRALKILERSYLLKVSDRVVERPQFLYMCVAVSIHKLDTQAVLETYNLLSRGFYSHASPTMWSAGCIPASYASCYMHRPDAETFNSVLKSVRDVSSMWESDGGIGLDMGSVPASTSVSFLGPLHCLVDAFSPARRPLRRHRASCRSSSYTTASPSICLG